MIQNNFRTAVVHFSSKKTMIESSGRFIILYNRSDNLKIIIKLPFSFPRDLFLGIPLLKRLLRSEAKEVIYNEETGKLVIIRDAYVYLIQDSSYTVLGKVVGDAPLFNSHCIQDGNIYFGQYDQNKNRNASKIYKIDLQNNLSVAYSFPVGDIRHVHSVIKDPYVENRIWITTGDDDGECFLLYTDDNFKNISNIGDKSQDFRIVNLGFSKDHLFYGTDNLLKENFIYRQNRSDGRRKKILSIKQTAWFLKQDKNGNAILGTTVEHGKGCQVNYCSIYYSTDYGLTWLELIRIPKDIYPMPLFKWGSVSFSNGSDSLDDIFMNFEALKDVSGYSFNLGFLLNFSEIDLRKIEVKKRDYFRKNTHLMIVIYRLFSIYKNTKDLRFLNLLLKLIDWMPSYTILRKRELRSKALKIYENINNCTD